MENLLAGEVLQHNLTHKHETVLGFTAFPVVYFRTFNGYLDLFFILAHSQLVRIALREMHVHFVATNNRAFAEALRPPSDCAPPPT